MNIFKALFFWSLATAPALLQPAALKQAYANGEKAVATGKKVIAVGEEIRNSQKEAAQATAAAQQDYDVKAALGQLKGPYVNFYNVTGEPYLFTIERADGVKVQGTLSPGAEATMYAEPKDIKRVSFSDLKNTRRNTLYTAQIQDLLKKTGNNRINLLLK